MINNLETGAFGEKKACEYLRKHGYNIIRRNFKKKFGEIDIIAIEHTSMLVFVEVKTLLIKEGWGFKPEDNFTSQKRIKVNRMAQFFAAKYPDMFDEDVGWRIDLIAVELFNDESWQIKHYENV